MAGNLALSIQPKAEVIEMPRRKEIEASKAEFSLVWLGIIAFCVTCWTGCFFLGYLLWRVCH